MIERIIKRNKSIIVACDFDIDLFEKVVKETADIENIGGYKIGFFLGLKHGLPKIAEVARKYTGKPLIYDHQKACTDIPATGDKFVKVCKDAGMDAIIYFPQSGPATQRAWIEAAQKQGIKVIVGGILSSSQFKRSEGGYIADEAIMEIFGIAAELGVNDYVVPGNKTEEIKKIREFLESKGVSPVLYAPGLIAQGGSLTEASEAAGEQWHAIVGRGIYQSKDIRKTALELSRELGNYT